MMKFRLLARIVFIFAAAIAAGCKHKTGLPKPDPDNGGLYLPSGFDALVVADSTGRARHLVVNDNGDVYVKLTYNDVMKGGGGTVGLRDLDGDGRADSIAYFGDYKDEGGSAVGVTIHDGYLYTSTVRSVLRNKLRAGELLPSSPTELVLTDTDPNVVHNWHTTKPLAFDNQGNMFVPFGSPSDGCHDMQYGPVGLPGGSGLNPCPDLEKHGGIWKFKAGEVGLTQDDGELYATGIRSVVGMQWNPDDEGLYAVVNGIDNFHTMYPDRFSSWQAAVLPAESLIKVAKGSNFGWPYAYYDHMQRKNFLAPAYGGDGKTEGRSDFDKPVMGFPGHWAPMDLLFYHGSQFPSRYKKGVFVAFHGSTDRSPYPQAGYIVCFVPFSNGQPIGTWEVFADGFTGVDTVANTSDARYRPMGLAEGPDGSLYISESNKGKIWRVMFRGEPDRFDQTSLAAMERRESRSYIKTPDEKDDRLNKGSVLEGSILYDTYCASCHAQNGKGDNNRFPPLADSDWVKGDPDRLINVVLYGLQGRIIVNGKSFNGLMPAHGHLDDHAVASILTYVRARFRNKATPVRTSEVTRVRVAGKPVK